MGYLISPAKKHVLEDDLAWDFEQQKIKAEADKKK
jgi:hypothetical protein